MNRFRGSNKKHSYFEGWYLKHQTDNFSIAFIPAFHVDEKGNKTASIQIITDSGSYDFPFLEKEFRVSKSGFCVKIGNNLFSDKGICVNLKNQEISVAGELYYSPFTRLNSDIMGPFRFIPFMQCNHGVLSMIHQIKGNLEINGKKYDFTGRTGYVEKDFGSSFPKEYTWTQCSDWSGKQDCSLMASAADIPFGCFRFQGCICAIWFHGKEYRIATYRGARITVNTEDELVLRQGRYTLSIKCLSRNEVSDCCLKAPRKGSMERMIKENIACTVHYIFTLGKRTIFDFTTERASFESVRTDDYEGAKEE